MRCSGAAADRRVRAQDRRARRVLDLRFFSLFLRHVKGARARQAAGCMGRCRGFRSQLHDDRVVKQSWNDPAAVPAPTGVMWSQLPPVLVMKAPRAHATRRRATPSSGWLWPTAVDGGCLRSHHPSAEARDGIVVNHKRVLRLMRQDTGRARAEAAFVPQIVDAAAATGRSCRTWSEDSTGKRPRSARVADITYIRLQEEFVYLAVIVDAFSRRCVDEKMADHLRASLAIDALEMALAERRLGLGQPDPSL